VTVERQGMTLLVGSAAAGFENCPLCGQQLAPVLAEQAKLRLREGSISQKDLPAAGTSAMSSDFRDKNDFLEGINKERFS
jgi:hypothetical protein